LDGAPLKVTLDVIPFQTVDPAERDGKAAREVAAVTNGRGRGGGAAKDTGRGARLMIRKRAGSGLFVESRYLASLPAKGSQI
jgi:hypothetical protein